MTRLQRAASLLRALRSYPAAASSLCGSASSVPPARAFSVASQPVAPAATFKDIADEWYLRQRNVITLGNRVPHIAVGVYIAPSAVVAGDVDLLDRVSIWGNVVLRGDLNNITVGAVTNIQDRTVIHAARTSPTGLSAATMIGKYVTVEPNCVLRSARVQDFCVVGARSVLLEGSLMEAYSRLEPGSVLPPARRVPEGELWGGVPAKFVRKLTPDEKAAVRGKAEQVRDLAWSHMSEQLPHGTAWRAVEAQRAALVAAGGYEGVNMRRVKYDLRKEVEAGVEDKQLSVQQ